MPFEIITHITGSPKNTPSEKATIETQMLLVMISPAASTRASGGMLVHSWWWWTESMSRGGAMA